MCIVQLQAAGIAPFFTNKQNLLMMALFEPLAAVCTVSTADLTQVHCSLKSSDICGSEHDAVQSQAHLFPRSRMHRSLSACKRLPDLSVPRSNL